MLLDLIQQFNKFGEVHSVMNKPGQIVHGLTNSAKSFALANLLDKSEFPIIYLTQSFHESQVYYQEVKNLSRKPVYNFLSQEISPYDQINSDISILNHQLEVFDAWKKAEASLTVIPFKSFSQLYANKEAFESNSFEINKATEISPGDLARKLIDLGYVHESMVDARGQFSHRGDIFDVYPIVGDAVRIEFFGDEIESIRSFAVSSQRSVKELASFLVHPRYLIIRKPDDGLQAKLEEAFKGQIKSLNGEAKDTLQTLYEQEIGHAEEDLYWEGVEYYRALLDNSSSRLVEYLPEKCHIVFDEWEDICLKAKSWEEQLEKQYEDNLSQGKILPLESSRSLHLSLEEINKELEKFPQKLYLQTFSEEGGDKTLSYELQSFPAEKYASKVEIFVEAIKKSLRDKQRVVIFSEQPQRVIGILKEWDVPSTYLESKDPKNPSNADLDINEPLVWILRDGTHEGFKLPDFNLVVLTDRELFGRSRQAVARQKTKTTAAHERKAYSDISQLKSGDYVVHYKHGVGLYQGVEYVELENFGSKQKREYLVVEYADEARLLIPVDQIHLLARYNVTGDSKPRLSKFGGAEWDRTKKKVKKSVKKIAQDLVNLYAIRAKQTGYKYPDDTPWQIEMEDAFPYTETEDQIKAIGDMKLDMQTNKLMDRLICGDAGFGKTEVVLRSVFKVIMEGKQVAILVPTTVLAQQHFNVFSDRFAPYPVRIGLLSRFRTAREQKETLEKLKIGECDLVIGTHRLLQKDVRFQDLGMLVIDEEQRFGVAHKEKLKSMRVDLDVITMSATPIPRTLHMALSGARDISLIGTPPVNRLPVKTFVGEYKESIVRNAILHELERGGQVFFLHNRVETIEQKAMEIKELVPEATVGVAHGQMGDRDLEDIMFSFVNRDFQVLVCTTIIETGLDISTANTIVIDNANAFGLAQLYQLRGRVGRSDTQAYAYCLYKPEKEISETARQRLKAIRELTNLGAGYQVALRDMEIRGVGNILGAEQHGHMLSVGFDLYCKLLNECIDELKGKPGILDYERDCTVDINITAYFPETWMPDSKQRMNEYGRLSEIRDEETLNELIAEWKDRFGNLPLETLNLIEILRIKLLANKARVTGITQEGAGIKILANMRLQVWLKIQRSLSNHLQNKTVFKSGSLDSRHSQPYILLKTMSMSPDEQMEALREIIIKLTENSDVKVGVS